MSFADDGGATVRHVSGSSSSAQAACRMLALALLVAGAACSGEDAADPDPFATPGAGGSSPLGYAPPAGAGSANAPQGASGSNGVGAGGTSTAGAGGPVAVAGAGGSASGAAGAAPAGGSGGAPSSEPTAGAGGTALIPPTPVGENNPPLGPDVECPAGATFCSGFETPALPTGARFDSNPMATLAFDSTVFNSGSQSIAFPAVADGFNIREVVVPIPGNTFWVRLFMRSDTAFGDNDHDSVLVASTTMGDNNSEDGVEFSEQGNQVLLNSNDQLFSAAGAGFPSGAGPSLAANTWHCLEGFFDGPSGDVQIFSGGELLIDAPGYRPLSYQTFRFGYLQFPGGDPRSVWFDDVVVASDRVGCD
jgi:hypothetical protein